MDRARPAWRHARFRSDPAAPFRPHRGATGHRRGAGPSAEARRLAEAACYDCHSNEPSLEWFDRIAPGSWIVAEHVAEGRLDLNFSEWDQYAHEVDDATDAIEDGEMPLDEYLWLHPEARLTQQEKRTLVDALRQLEGAEDDDRG